MASALNPEQTIAHGLTRLAVKELRSARAALHDRAVRDGSLHAARKSVKHVRAVLRLLGADHARGLATTEKHLRAANRALSPLRDAEVIVKSLHNLRRNAPELFSAAAFAQLRDRLVTRKRQLLRDVIKDGTIRDIRAHLRKAAAGTRHWRAAHKGFRTITAGMTISHQRSRAAMVRAERGQRPAQFHEWRRQLKCLWYQMRLLGPLAPLRGDVRALHAAEGCLGDDHDMVLLHDIVLAEIASHGLAVDPRRLRRATARYQAVLRKRALAGVRHICALEPREYAQRARRAWKDAALKAGT